MESGTPLKARGEHSSWEEGRAPFKEGDNSARERILVFPLLYQTLEKCYFIEHTIMALKFAVICSTFPCGRKSV